MGSVDKAPPTKVIIPKGREEGSGKVVKPEGENNWRQPPTQRKGIMNMEREAVKSTYITDERRHYKSWVSRSTGNPLIYMFVWYTYGANTSNGRQWERSELSRSMVMGCAGYRHGTRRVGKDGSAYVCR